MKDKDLYKYYQTKPRDRLELWLKLHNRKLELCRSLTSILALFLQIIILLKIFGRI